MTAAPFVHPPWCERATWVGEPPPAWWTDREEEDGTHRGQLYYADTLDLSDVSVTFQVIQRFERSRGQVLHHAPAVEVISWDREGPERSAVVYTLSEWERLVRVTRKIRCEMRLAHDAIEAEQAPRITA